MSDRQWEIVRRWESYGGERSVNVMRSVAVVVFYGIELLCYRVLDVPGVDARFHAAMSAICIGWGCMAVVVHLLLVRRFFPVALKYVVTGLDLAFATGALLVGAGPQSPLLALYFLILAASVLRFSPRLVSFTIGGCLVSYLVVLGNAHWARPEFQVPRHRQIVFAAAVLLGGVLLVLAVKRARVLATAYVERLREDTGA